MYCSVLSFTTHCHAISLPSARARWQLTMRLPKGIDDLYRLDLEGRAAVL